MKSYTTLRNLGGTLSTNTSSTNLSLFDQLINDEHRYLLQKYYNNETSFSITTIGSTTLTLTGIPAVGATSATLTVAWPYDSCSANSTFANGEQRVVNYVNGSTAITWQLALVGTTLALTTTLTMGGVQTYKLPGNYSKLKTGTLRIGNLQWTPKEILTRQEWDNLNVFPYYADIPNNFFIWSNKFNFWPIPSTTGNVITFNYKYRVPDLTFADYTTGTVAVTNGSYIVTGTTTSWLANYLPVAGSVANLNLWIQITAPKGDNNWYQVSSIESATSLTLVNPYQGGTASGASYTIGQMPLLIEDFQDLPIYGALVKYFSSIVDNPNKRKEFQDTYDRKILLLEEYAGSKTIDVNLGRRAINRNPNLFPNSIGGTP